MTESTTRVLGLGKHYLGVAAMAVFIVLVVAAVWYWLIPKLNEKTDGKTQKVLGPGGGAAASPNAPAAPAAAGFSVA